MAVRAAVILAALVGLLWLGLLLTRDRDGADLDPTEPALRGHRLGEAVRLQVRGQPEAQPIVLERAAGHAFAMTEPMRDLASQARLAALAAAWDGARLVRVHSREDATPDLLRRLGLDPPRAALRATFPDADIAVELGDEGPLGEELWVRRDGIVYQGSKALLSTIAGTVDDYREPLLFQTDLALVREVRIERRPAGGEREALALQRVGGGEWRLRQPLVARARADVSNSLVASVLGLQARQFVLGNVELRPEPDYAVDVEGAAGRESVRLWRQAGEVLLGHQSPRDVAFTLGAADCERLLRLPSEALRSRLLNPHAPDELMRIALDPGDGGRVAVLQRGANQVFELHQPIRVAANPTAVAQLLEALTTLTAQEFVAGEPGQGEASALTDGGWRVELVGPHGGRPIELRLGRDDGELTYARRTDEPYAVKVPRASAAALRQGWTRFVALEVYRAASLAVIQRLRYVRGEQRRSYAKGEDGIWRGEGESDEAAGVAEAVDVLGDLVAVEALEPDQVDGLGPALAIDLRAGNDMALASFELFARGDDVLLRRPGLEVAFKLSRRDGRDVLAPAPRE